ncbi:hypothetical protein [Winogradskyella flava]
MWFCEICGNGIVYD